MAIDESLTVIELLRPDAIPFWTAEYAAAMAADGHEVVRVPLEAGRTVPGFVRRGRLGANLLIPSLPVLADPVEAGASVLSYCRRQRFTTVELPCFATPHGPLPVGAHRAEIYGRTEHLIDLRGSDDLGARLSRTHRQRARQGRTAGLTLRRTSAVEALDAHLTMIGLSMARRRDRGETVPASGVINLLTQYLCEGAGELFQAIAKDEVVASMLVLHATAGAYDQSSGSSPAGMKVGAMHFLVLETALMLRSEGRDVFNLGGTRAHEEGLRAFKTAFGSLAVDVQAGRWDLAGPRERLLRRIVALLRGVQRAVSSSTPA